MADDNDDGIFKSSDPVLYVPLVDLHRDEDKKRRQEKENPLPAPFSDQLGPGASSDNDNRAYLKDHWLDDFIDTDFSKQSFQDLRNLDGKQLLLGQTDWLKEKRDDSRKDDKYWQDDGKKSDDNFKRAQDRRDKDRRLEDLKEMREIDVLPEGYLHDWVPADPDPRQNGAFSIAPDNGSPVPYKLNGWVVIQRGLPWEAHN